MGRATIAARYTSSASTGISSSAVRWRTSEAKAAAGGASAVLLGSAFLPGLRPQRLQQFRRRDLAVHDVLHVAFQNVFDLATQRLVHPQARGRRVVSRLEETEQ